MRVLQETVLKACDEIDGLKDGIMNDPRDCDFDLSDLPLCVDDMPRNNCFTIDQIEAIKTIYEGVMINDKKVYPGFFPLIFYLSMKLALVFRVLGILFCKFDIYVQAFFAFQFSGCYSTFHFLKY